MNKIQTSLLKNYYKKLKAEIPFSYPERKRLLKDMQTSLYVYATEHPSFTDKDLIENFGEPSALADSLIELDSSENIRKQIFSNKKAKLYLAIVIVAIIITAFFVLKICGEFATQYMETTVIYESETSIIHETETSTTHEQ